jgi:hypothetical protein
MTDLRRAEAFFAIDDSLFWHEAALGLMPAVTARVEVDPPPQPEQLSGPFWNACHGGQLAVAPIPAPARRRSQLGRSLVETNTARYRRARGAERYRGLVDRKGCQSREETARPGKGGQAGWLGSALTSWQPDVGYWPILLQKSGVKDVLPVPTKF